MSISSNSLLEGNLGSISLPNLVQLIALEQKTATLTLSRVEIGQNAELVFHHGHLISARVNNLEGDFAMYRILGWWNAGTFKLLATADDELPDTNITMRMDYLLLEGMRQMDACAQYRELVPHLTSAVSFTQAALDSFAWDRAEPPEWIPGIVRGLPRSFSMAQLHAACELDEVRLGNLMKMLLSTQAVRVHTGQTDEWGENPSGDGQKSTRYEAFAQLIMEYVGYEQAYGLVDQSLYDLGWDDLESVSFTQLLDLCDRLSMALNQYLERRQVNEAIRRLRARATSLL
ncbi:MAG: transcriptional regulator [Cyanobacteria bacterium RYN_339]|nr:transcriptional regulator [Cyanobacteria bacterium RYN_339]